MKISKLVSLVLVFVMLASVFSMVTVSAADSTANIGFVVYDAAGKVHTGDLVIGKNYEIAVKVTDISNSQFAGVAFTAYYDSAVIKPIKADGTDAATEEEARVAGSGVYAEKFASDISIVGEPNWGEAQAGSTGAVFGGSYAMNVNKVLAGTTKMDNISEVEIIRYRFKAEAVGATGLKFATTSDYALAKDLYVYSDGNPTVKHVHTVLPLDLKVRDLNLASAEVSAVPAVYGFESTDTADTVKAGLPATVKVSFTDENGDKKDVDCAITWVEDAGDAFDATADKGFKFIGTIAVPENYTGEELGTLEAQVAPKGKETFSFDKTEVKLPATGEIKTDAGYTADKVIEEAGKFLFGYGSETPATEAAIVWDAASKAAFDGTKAGTYVIKGLWSDNYGNSQEVKIEVVVKAAGADSVEIRLKKTGSAVNKTTMLTNDELKLFAKMSPEGIDEVVWSADKSSSYLTIKTNKDGSATIKTKNAIGKIKVTATTKNSNKSATIEINVINQTSSDNGGTSYYYGSYGGSNLLAQAATEAEDKQHAAVSPFIDIEGYEWAANAIEVLRSNGIVTGKTASEFKPGDYVTRAEFLAFLVRLFKLNAGANVKTFNDVNVGDWYYDVVTIASSLGIAEGYSDGSFKPNALVSRQDMTVLAQRAMAVAKVTPVVGVTRTFTDEGEISAYAKSAVQYMTSIGVINGMNDGSFRPQDPANRAQASVVIYNILAKMK